MNNEVIEEAISRADKRFEEYESRYDVSRRGIRKASEVINKLHRKASGEDIDISRELDELKALWEEYAEENCGLGAKNGSFDVEYAEAMIFHALITSGKFPSHQDIDVSPEAYLMGLGDVVGELRRYALNMLSEGRREEAKWALEVMETIYEYIVRCTYSSGFADIRRKADMARGIIDRTKEMLIYRE